METKFFAFSLVQAKNSFYMFLRNDMFANVYVFFEGHEVPPVSDKVGDALPSYPVLLRLVGDGVTW